MVALNSDVVRSLASFKGGDGPVVSLCLDVDGRRFVRPKDYELHLVERRVDTLVVSDGYEAPGWRCPACGYLAGKGPACPVCPRSTMQRVDDVVEEAVEDALGQSCRVDVVVGTPIST